MHDIGVLGVGLISTGGLELVLCVWDMFRRERQLL